MGAPQKVGVEAFSFEFDWEDDHCSWSNLEWLREELHDSYRSRFADCNDMWEALDIIEKLLEASDDPDDDVKLTEETRDVLSTGASRIEACTNGQCCCSSDDWACEQDYVDGTLLSELGDQLWVVDIGGSPAESDLDDILSVEKLHKLVESREGWSRLNLTWDGATLTADFSYYRAGTSRVSVVALSGPQRQAARYLSDYHEDTPGRRAGRLDDHVASMFVPFLEASDYDGRDETFDRLLAEAADNGVNALADAAKETAAGLSEDWSGSFTELIGAARILNETADSPVAGFAIAA